MNQIMKTKITKVTKFIRYRSIKLFTYILINSLTFVIFTKVCNSVIDPLKLRIHAHASADLKPRILLQKLLVFAPVTYLKGLFH